MKKQLLTVPVLALLLAAQAGYAAVCDYRPSKLIGSTATTAVGGTPILAADVYQNAFEKIDSAIFVRSNTR